MRNRHVFSFICVLILSPLSGARLNAQPSSLNPAVQESLSQNVRRLNPINVSWIEAEDSVATSEPGGSLSLVKRLSLDSEQFIWQDGKIYWRTAPALDGGSDAFDKLRLTEEAFDGNVLYSGEPNGISGNGAAQPKLVKDPIGKLVESRPNDRFFELQYFEDIGIQLPSTPLEMKSRLADSRILALLASGAQLTSVESAQLDGHSLIRIRLIADNPERKAAERIDLVQLERELRRGMNSEAQIQNMLADVRQTRQLAAQSTYSFYVDPQLNYAIRQWDERADENTVIRQVNNDDFGMVDGRDIWLPRKCVMVRTLHPGTNRQALRRNSISLEHIELGSVPATQFALSYTIPGSRITDNTLPTRERSYRVAAPQDALDKAVASAQTMVQLSGSQKEQLPSKWPIWAGFGAMIAIAICGYVLLRSKARVS